MRDGFVPLDVFFRQSTIAEPVAGNAGRDEIPSAGLPVGEEKLVEKRDGGVDAAAAVRRFHAALTDALDAAVDELLPAIAREVLGRELATAPADLAAIAGAALGRYEADSPIRLRAHPGDTAALAGLSLAVIADSKLRRGDLVIDVRSGTIDASVDARLGRVLESITGA